MNELQWSGTISAAFVCVGAWGIWGRFGFGITAFVIGWLMAFAARDAKAKKETKDD